ncbi:NAD(P)/FAD-dependent oxidoreductase [Paraburkholderia fynbosensis]|uniref:Hydrogen cyanide synthase subunit HcnB n=1 Tax=Paraburkholderia fynbosensis TaxID=1200993 RepID=A0A6J5H3I4_9BURK|nr:NAD(P)/FAD-dependent oxidoreductase [Paraburkholderia fynbosensis]CAB3809899.1 Hydrogen cyanide synthase subunit HcnB [Paraburkholderia fynbosensis]
MSEMKSLFDVIVLGGGPAGTRAALAAASTGMRVALFDENASAGGQVYRAPIDGVTSKPDADQADGDALRRELATSSVTTFFRHPVWAVTGNYRVDATGPHGPLHCTARALIVASGTTERVVPFEGWTTPGVIGLAAATILLKSQHMLPGRSTLVAGCGPLLAAVAAKTIEGGGKVEAIVDLASTGDWARSMPALLGRPDLLRQGFKWWNVIRRAGTPRYARHTIVRVEPLGECLRATLAPCDAAGRVIDGERKTVLSDCIAVGHGLTPSSEITRLLRAKHRYSRAAGGWIAIADADGRTSRPLLFVAGDGAGIAGAAAAATHGTLAGLACARDLGAPQATAVERVAKLRDAYRDASRFGHAMAKLMALRPGHVDSIALDTIVCRCEDVTRAEIDAACDAGAHDVNQLKAWTRCGMGPCQGRTCGDVAGELLMRRLGAPSRDDVGCFSARTPLRPVTIEALTGDFSYDDIPIPKAAPL